MNKLIGYQEPDREIRYVAQMSAQSGLITWLTSMLGRSEHFCLKFELRSLSFTHFKISTFLQRVKWIFSFLEPFFPPRID